jgi:eukaryotic-like serine/threonine-protein kinase
VSFSPDGQYLVTGGEDGTIKLGFSIQKEIWENLGGTENADYQIYRNFSKRVGWGYGNASWFFSCELTFNNTAPFGHLP